MYYQMNFDTCIHLAQAKKMAVTHQPLGILKSFVTPYTFHPTYPSPSIPGATADAATTNHL